MTTIDSLQAHQATTICFETTVTRVGPEAKDMVDGGVMIFFSDPVPPALEDISVIHAPSTPLEGPLKVGDLVECGGATAVISAVGEHAAANLEQLGHVVFYLAPTPDTKLLPGAVHLDAGLPMPDPATTIRVTRPQH